MGKRFRIMLSCFLCFVLIVGVPMSAFAQNEGITPPASSDTPDYYPDMAAAAAAVRAQMVAREPIITVTYLSDTGDAAQINTIAALIYAHTGVPDEGDYLQFHCKKCTVDIDAQSLGSQFLVTLTFTVTYYSTAAQEQAVNTAVDALLQELDVYDLADQFKVKAIYDYICKNVSYDSWGALIKDPYCHTTHAALIGKTAVCQGYVTLFYRLALELGVDARVISGTSRNSNHGWNIVRLDDVYYSLDTTWDAENAVKNRPYEYFLHSDKSFTDHIRKDKYTTAEFVLAFPSAPEDYFGPKGDTTGDWIANEDDALYLLKCILMPENFQLSRSADYDGNGVTEEADVLRFLKYLLMPELYPL